MSFKTAMQNFLDKYMRSCADKLNVPDFAPDTIKRYQMIFSGDVQGVGFRYETWLIADKLGLTGFCKNLANGDVLAEIQGPNNRIDYLVSSLQKIPRIEIRHIKKSELPLKEETDFLPLY